MQQMKLEKVFDFFYLEIFLSVKRSKLVFNLRELWLLEIPTN